MVPKAYTGCIFTFPHQLSFGPLPLFHLTKSQHYLKTIKTKHITEFHSITLVSIINEGLGVKLERGLWMKTKITIIIIGADFVWKLGQQKQREGITRYTTNQEAQPKTRHHTIQNQLEGIARTRHDMIYNQSGGIVKKRSIQPIRRHSKNKTLHDI